MTTEKLLLKNLIQKGEEMRNKQKSFFACKDNPAKKAAWLADSKSLEREFDKLIIECKKVVKY